MHTCALLDNGSANCWGQNYYGQLGDGTMTNRLTPVTVSGLSGVVTLVAGDDHTCALLADRGARCWGSNYHGQLGDGTTTDWLTPTTVSSLSGVAALTARSHTCAVLDDGSARCWGNNNFGQIGDGTAGFSSVPVAVAEPVGDGGSTCARFVSDGNYPDGTVVNPGQVFEKRWRLLNCGPASWNGYQAERISGDYGPATFPVSGAAGATIDVSATFTAPLTLGTYRATYKLRGPQGLFGDAFWVEVRVRPGPLPNATVSGRVTAADRGLGGVLITAFGSRFAFTLSAADGSYRFADMPAGNYQLTAMRLGYAFGAPKLVTLPPDAQELDFVGQAITPPPSRKIAIMVHGWQGFETDRSKYDCQIEKFVGPYQRDPSGEKADVPGWDLVGQQLTKLGYEVYLANWTTSFWYTTTAEDAARDCLAPQIASVVGDDSDGKVLLVAHSMGGLVSRAYIENADRSQHQPDVEALITLGTPHVGVNLNTLIKIVGILNPNTQLATVAICVANPGLCQLGSDAMLLFNIAHTPRHDVPYLFMGGSGGPDWLGFVNFTEGRNDGIAGFRSATGYQYQYASSIPFTGRPLHDDYLLVQGTNIVRRYSDSSHGGIPFVSKPWYADDVKVNECVASYLGHRSSLACSTMREPVLNAMPAQAPQQAIAFTPTQFGTLRSGEIITATLDLEGTEAMVLLSASDGQLSLTLTAPDGTLLTPTNAVQIVPGAQYSEPTTTGDPPIVSYRLPNPPAGRWVATIAATDVISETAYALVAALQSALTLEVERPSSVGVGQSFIIQATLRDGTTPVDGATVSVTLPTTQATHVVTLTRTAPGLYSGQLTAPAEAGPHLFTVTATGSTTTPFARQFDDLITVQASGVQRRGAAIVTPVDRDGNGRYEALELTVPYTAAIAGDYAGLATLQDASGRVIALARTQVTWAVGDHTLRFSFVGGEILASGVNGPYRVVAQIVKTEGAQLMVDEQPLVDGLNYQANDFEGASPIQRVYLPFVRRS
ncbi:carboxypeptidase regulatory-like domain-containing protein [Candidatus Chloroploca sp. M-50]|uniref:Carboxypeptidase regulatory-like domain-containing protein n=1 Tax=Candidatus Chloroploca mongolica TaxID=2528176 RepID=A0ABS4D4K3_9CHLR|nr:NBR1-Ig-like domain-containing protein [Candidatus Chloroploca mongolica]MBP1464367.1 carboxypeptidase regulatory-like domain-containing protein [Candidatus Chloroploca mongolica]